MAEVMDYPLEGAAEDLYDYAAQESRNPQGKEEQELWEKAREAILEWTRIPFDLPFRRRQNPLRRIQPAIESSRYLLQLEDDWDTEGSPAITEATWTRAVEWLNNHAVQIWRSHGIEIDPPDIGPGPDGSIDLHWDFPEYELLINFPTDPDAMADCYGDDRGAIRFKATFDPKTTNEGVLLWLKNAK
ncbi:MAG: hypothetical protein IID37_12430 [Planctomycetes bacterium]|nr:hypothetical protein [Planctomycetota bacterium]